MTSSSVPAAHAAERRIDGAQAWRVPVRTTGLVALAVLLVLRLGGVATSGVGPVLLAVALLFGLPHGAADVGAPVLTSHGRTMWAAALAGYATAAAAVFLLWWVAPVPTLLALLVLAVAHFGLADVEGRALGGIERTAAILALGGLPVVVPLALHGDAVRTILVELTGGCPEVVVTVARYGLVVVVAAAVVTVCFALRRRQWTTAVEPLLLAATFGLVSPLLAFAAYYGLWHSLRQGAATFDDTAGRLHLDPRRATLVVLRRTALPTLAVVLVGLALALTGHLPVLSTALVVVLCLTVPHSICAAVTSLFAAHPGVRKPPTSRKASTP